MQGRKKLRHFEINEAEADVVRCIYRWYTVGDGNGKSLKMAEIAKRLKDLGIPRKTETDKNYQRTNRQAVSKNWPTTIIKAILKRSDYKGVWYYNKRHCRKTDYNLPRELVAVDVPPIVDEILWDMAQQRRKDNRQDNHRILEYLFARRIRCGCGYAMRCSPNTKRGHTILYYSCITKRSDYDRRCSSPCWPAAKVDAAV